MERWDAYKFKYENQRFSYTSLCHERHKHRPISHSQRSWHEGNLEKIEGKVLIRGKEDEIPDGVYHLVCDTLVQHVDGSYLLMKRDYRKHNGGMWEATAGGSALIGESPLQCAARELKEETGIEFQKLTEVGRIVSDKDHSIYVEFLCVTEWDKKNIKMQEGETIDFKWVSKDELLSMSKNELLTERIQKFVFETL